MITMSTLGRCRMFAVALIILAPGLSGLLLGCTRTQEIGAPAATATPAPDKVLGQFHLVRGTEYVRAPILQVQRSSGSGFSSSSYTSSTTYNFVFVNRRDDTIRQLLPTNDTVILSTIGLPEAAAQDASTALDTDAAEGPAILWFLYRVVTADTNSDEQLSQDDLQTLALSDADGTGYTRVITDVQTVHGHTLSNEQTLVIIYRQHDKVVLSRIDLPTRAILKTTAFPALGADVR